MINYEHLIQTFLKRSSLTDEELLQKANGWDESILNDPNISKKIGTTTPLHVFVKGNTDLTVSEVLKNPDISRVTDSSLETPLHLMAETFGDFQDEEAITALLKHPDIGKVKNNLGMTPLHILSNYGVEEVQEHPLFNNVKDNSGKTPKDIYGKKHQLQTLFQRMDAPTQKRKRR